MCTCVHVCLCVYIIQTYNDIFSLCVKITMDSRSTTHVFESFLYASTYDSTFCLQGTEIYLERPDMYRLR